MNKLHNIILQDHIEHLEWEAERVSAMSAEERVQEFNKLLKIMPVDSADIERRLLLQRLADRNIIEIIVHTVAGIPKKFMTYARDFKNSLLDPIHDLQMELSPHPTWGSGDATTTEADPLVPALKQAGVAVVPVQVIKDGDTLRLCLWWFENRPTSPPTIHTSVESQPESPESINASCEIELDDHQATVNFPGLIKKWGDAIPDDLKIGLDWNAETNELTVDFSIAE